VQTFDGDGGRPLLSWVLKGLSGCNVDDIAVATDHEDIAALARKEGFEAIMTPSELPSGATGQRGWPDVSLQTSF